MRAGERLRVRTWRGLVLDLDTGDRRWRTANGPDVEVLSWALTTAVLAAVAALAIALALHGRRLWMRHPG